MLQCVILSGGSGTRLWPLSRELFPKQLINLQGGGETLLQATLTRTEGLSGLVSPAIVCNENHRFLVAEQVRALGVSGAKVILEPCARNTAPAIALAALAADPEALLLVLPADHVIQDKGAFQAAVSAAIPVAEQGKLVTFGVVPTVQRRNPPAPPWIRLLTNRALTAVPTVATGVTNPVVWASVRKWHQWRVLMPMCG